jgi:hypothetical protein
MHRGDARASALVDQAIDDGRRPLSLLGEDFEAYLDVQSIVHNFKVLDREYPGSKFILTTSADVESWLQSRRRHVEANRCNKEYDGPWYEVDEVGWVEEWKAHHAAVLRHFANRPEDLLVFDVRAGHGWERLSPFVGMPEPSRRFPWLNSAGRGTYRGEPRLDVVRRRVWALEGVIRRRLWCSRHPC